MSTKLSIAEMTDRDRLKLRRSQQLEFLLTVLRSIHQNNGNPDIIYALFRQNLNLLDLDIVEVFSNWIKTKFDRINRATQKLGFGVANNLKDSANTKTLKNNRAEQESIAIDILNFGNLIQQFPLGNKAVNMELSIECYVQAIKVFTISEDPKNWGVIQNNLATAYSDRIKGDRAENLEQSIECYRAALEVHTPEAFPCEWAKIQVALAQFSIEKLQNYQVATEHLQSAYKHLLTNNNDTGLLAQTMFQLARCFHQTGCLEQAKVYFKDSIRLYQRLEQPTQVAAATSALGNLELQMGLLDDARLHLQTALEFYQAVGSLERVESIQELQQYLPVTSGAAGS